MSSLHNIDKLYKIQMKAANSSNIVNGPAPSKNLDVKPTKNFQADNNVPNNVTKDDIFNFMDLYFNRDRIIYSHQYSSFNKFVNEDIKTFLENGDHVFSEKISDNQAIKYKFKFSDIRIIPPMMENGDPMFPSDARSGSLTYSAKLVAKVRQIQETTDIVTDERIEKEVGHEQDNVPITSLPIMVRSQYCSLSLYKNVDKLECHYDPGAYFIINGSEKVVVPQDKMSENKPLVFNRKDTGGDIFAVQVNSKSHKPNGIAQTSSVRLKTNNILIMYVPILSEVNVIAIMRALGIETDKDIINYIVYDETDSEMADLLRTSMTQCVNDRGEPIQTQEEALDYLINKMKVNKKYSESDKLTRNQQRKLHLKSLFANGFIPHIENTLKSKAVYLGYMINKLLQVVLGRINKDDRDSYINKRIDLPGDLLNELFIQSFRKMKNECTKFFKKRNQSDSEPINIINQIKPNIIEQGLKNALMTGSWIKRKGVAQMLQRLTFLYTISSLRRVDAPGGDASTSKITGPRQLHDSSVRWLCCVQTPEHAKVGLTKHLSLIGSISILQTSQIFIIKSFIKEQTQNVLDVDPSKIKNYTKVFLNGEWVGLTLTPNNLYQDLRTRKLNGTFDPTVGIVYDIMGHEIKVYCDGGRGFAPAITVKDNQITLTKQHIQSISLDKSNRTKITSWEEFMMKNPGVIEYIDMEEQSFKMIADKISTVESMRKRMDESLNKVPSIDPNAIITNRYDDMMYIKYSHCEFHPAFLLGEITTNAPFCNCNAGPRNIFYYAQGRQAMGIYTSNYRDRLDISYILFHPQRPVVITKTAKYVHSDVLPSGENVVVAIACYTGYNQEDSLVFSKAAIQSGLFRSKSVKKVITSIQKNQSTAQDDQFMKPDATKVSGMRHSSYEKLNDRGYVPEETQIVNGDIIIGKVSPVQPTGNNSKPFRDCSEVYKSHVPGVIDRVYTGIFNNEGYEMMKVCVRSMRVPTIGDKFCSRHGQKGTIGIQLKASDSLFTASGLSPDVTLNPNAIPSRMTVGQLIECVLGKVATIEGHDADGTPFNDIDIEEIKDKLESHGFHRDGVETMYNGMTGEKLKVMIFIGPTYYHRLKHLVEDKLHSRARGPRTILTRQPPEGRSREGGLRLGEMERDSLLGHGMALFLKEKLLDTSDAYTTYVCNECGLFAQRIKNPKDTHTYIKTTDKFFCNACKNYTKISKVMIPYAFKLLIQELLSLNIAPRIRTKQSAFKN